MIVKIFSEFYNDKEIEKAKTVQYDSCTIGRLKFRKGQKRRQANVIDMLSVIHGIAFTFLCSRFTLSTSIKYAVSRCHWNDARDKAN